LIFQSLIKDEDEQEETYSRMAVTQSDGTPKMDDAWNIKHAQICSAVI